MSVVAARIMFTWLKHLLRRGGSLGERGERLAVRHLRKLGYRVICRNFRCHLGEIDIIARDGPHLVFVEVKSRSYDEPRPEQQVDQRKRRQLTRLASHYLGRYGQQRPAARFDIIAIVWPAGGEPEIRHTPAAFEAAW